MELSFDTWWLWAVASAVLGILELLTPTFLFLGFAIGTGVTAIILLIGGPFAAWLGESLPGLILFSVGLSLIAWIVLRQVVGIRSGQVRTFDRDINED